MNIRTYLDEEKGNKTFYILASKNVLTMEEKEMSEKKVFVKTNGVMLHLAFVIDNPKEYKEYWWSRNFWDARIFEFCEVVDYLKDNPQERDGTIIIEMNTNYLNSVQDKPEALYNYLTRY